MGEKKSPSSTAPPSPGRCHRSFKIGPMSAATQHKEGQRTKGKKSERCRGKEEGEKWCYKLHTPGIMKRAWTFFRTMKTMTRSSSSMLTRNLRSLRVAKLCPTGEREGKQSRE